MHTLAKGFCTDVDDKGLGGLNASVAYLAPILLYVGIPLRQ